jgi:hypothetical protein
MHLGLLHLSPDSVNRKLLQLLGITNNPAKIKYLISKYPVLYLRTKFNVSPREKY